MRRAFNVAHAFNRFMRLPESDRWLIVEAGLYLLCARIAIITLSARTLLALGSLDAEPFITPIAGFLPPEIPPAIVAIDKASYHLRFPNCLVRSVALRLFLARRDIATEVHIGARKDEQGQFAAHAWLTYNGTILVGGDNANHLYRELIGASRTLL